jgi:hypothetical protein
MTPESDPFDPTLLRIPQEILAKLRGGEIDKRLVWDRTRRKFVEPHELPVTFSSKFKFVQLPVEGFGRLAVAEKALSFLVLLRLEELWFKGYKRNPVILPGFEICGLRITRQQKRRALQKLKAAGLIETEQRMGKSVQVTLLWRTVQGS